VLKPRGLFSQGVVYGTWRKHSVLSVRRVSAHVFFADEFQQSYRDSRYRVPGSLGTWRVREELVKTAIAIKSCHKYSDRRQSQLDTWLKEVDCDFFFLVGGVFPDEHTTDVLWCNSSDEFANIAPKVLYSVEYALENNFTNLCVCDDDTYIHWPRMKASGFEKFDYLGFVRNHGETPYMQGSCYWLNQWAMEMVVNHKKHMVNGVPDDFAVGRCLYGGGEVTFTHEHRYAIGNPYPEPEQWPQPSNEIIAVHKMNFMSMHACNELWKG